MNNWLELFPENILERGYSYHLHGFVSHLNYTSKHLTATVSGTEDYKVVITWDEKTNMTCDCLYAIEGKNCKHMAAVLFAYEERPIKKSNYSLSELSSLVSSASSSLVRELLTEILIEHPQFIERFKEKIPLHAVNYTDKLATIIHKYDHPIGKNKNRKTAKFIMEMRKFIQEAVESLIQQNAYLSAFELINEVIATLETCYLEPADERSLLLIEDCYYLWKELLAEAPRAEKRQMFSWFVCQVDHTDASYSKNYSIKILKEEFQEKEFSSQKKKITKKRKKSVKKGEPHKKGQTHTDKQSKSIKKTTGSTLKNTDDTSKIENLKKRLLASDSIHFPTLEKLKNACPPETWPIIRNELFSALKYHKNVDRFYAAEGCYDLLWEYVKSTDSLIMVDRHFDILKNYCPKQLLQKYEFELRQNVANFATKLEYQKLGNQIEKMASLPNGLVTAKLLTKELREKYPRRKALTAEMKRIEPRLK